MEWFVQRLQGSAVWIVKTIGYGWRQERFEAPDTLVTPEHEDLQPVNLYRLLVEVDDFALLRFGGSWSHSGVCLYNLADGFPWLLDWLSSLCLRRNFKSLWLFHRQFRWLLGQFLRSETMEYYSEISLPTPAAHLKISILSILVGLRSGIGARRTFFPPSFGDFL